MTKPVAAFRSGVIGDSRHTIRLDENSRLVLWNKHHQARPFSERKSRIHSNGPIQRTKNHSPSCT